MSDFLRYNAKLTPELVREMRREYAAGQAGIVTYRDLAAKHGVGECCINAIILRKTWRRVKDEGEVGNYRRSIAKLTPQKVQQMRREYAAGQAGIVTYKDLMKKYGVGEGCVIAVIRRRTWKWVKDEVAK